ncbi:hypothetical protein [Staphylococcus massiliensis]|uniref:Uncharacterized protein n=1 Tax=Staphylococcus massiliensis S46 TaxID=1229783 RepID=K9AW62_9STAP|nr:hypothetical protein [Staphylococcus massiliensis]EKU50311.1 hypothetical protein C273_01675 [Staphylococcus massiliensis S46]
MKIDLYDKADRDKNVITMLIPYNRIDGKGNIMSAEAGNNLDHSLGYIIYVKEDVFNQFEKLKATVQGDSVYLELKNDEQLVEFNNDPPSNDGGFWEPA